ncbi:stage V sporulation protein M [Paenibacillus xylanexedens]
MIKFYTFKLPNFFPRFLKAILNTFQNNSSHS